jgi:hypothetical protein
LSVRLGNKTIFRSNRVAERTQADQLRDAALYIAKLPKEEHDTEEWQAAMAPLLLVAEHDGPTTFARIGVMRALNRRVERVFNSDRKDQHWGRRKLARDQ